MFLFRIFLLIAVIVSSSVFRPPNAEASGVGYITILNGQLPSEAFTLERDGVFIQPTGVYTDLNEGDTVRTLPNSDLCFTPLPPSSPCTPITGCFVTKKESQRPAAGSLQILDYDLGAGQFKSRPLKPEPLYGRKGDSDQVLFTLPPQTVSIYTDSRVFRSWFEKMPFVKFTSSPEAADIQAEQSGDNVQLTGSGGLKTFQITGQEDALQREILKSLARKTLNNQGNSALAPEFRWSIKVHAPASFGNISLKDQKWIIEKEIQVEGPSTIPVAAGQRLLTFSFDNRSQENYFVYLVSLDGQGNFDLADLDDQARPLPAGQRRVDRGFYEPQSEVEYLWLIISEYPLDLQLFKSETGGHREPLTVTYNPAPKNSWKSLPLTIKK